MKYLGKIAKQSAFILIALLCLFSVTTVIAQEDGPIDNPKPTNNATIDHSEINPIIDYSRSDIRIAEPAALGTNLIINGDFEANEGWTSCYYKEPDRSDLVCHSDTGSGIIGTGDRTMVIGYDTDLDLVQAFYSDSFTIPSVATELTLQYDYSFVHEAGTCEALDGDFNGVAVYLINSHPPHNYYVLNTHTFPSDPENPDFLTKEITLSNVENLKIKDIRGGSYYIEYLAYSNSTTDCHIVSYTDDVSLIPTIDENASSPVYRFWSDTKQGHFYTINAEEKNHIIDTYADSVWRYEGIAYNAYNYQSAGTTPVYRFWSDQKQGHFYTVSEEEKNHVIDTYDDSVWRYEGIGYYVYPLDYSGDAQTVFRFWSDEKQKHFYTASEEEKDYVIENYDDNVWRYEGEAWKVLN